MIYPPTYPTINCHTHAYEFDIIAGDGFSRLRTLKDTMAACGYDRINIMSLACYQDEYVAHNALYALIKAMYPGRLYAFGSLYYPPGGFPGGHADFADQARRWIDAGMDGMKMEEGKPTTRRRTGIPLDSPLYDEYYRYLETLAEQRRRVWGLGEEGLRLRRELFDEMQNNQEPVFISDLAVNGGDLIERGMKEGSEIGRLLGLLLDTVHENPEKNKKNLLLELAAEKYVKL
jgi:hypothetical protein